MRHFVARTLGSQDAFTTWEEGLRLWDSFTSAGPGAIVCVMPNHVHILAPESHRQRFQSSLSSYARWLNHRRGATGPLWQPLADAGDLIDQRKIQRSIRYIHLNPCRAGIVEDPLAWPFSTHRDLVGLTLRPAAERCRRPIAFHRYVSADPTVHTDGTYLPGGVGIIPDTSAVRAAVSALCRRTDRDLLRRGPARNLLVRAAKAMTDDQHDQIARDLHVGLRTVERAGPLEPHERRRILAVLGDPRFPLLRGEACPWGDARGWRRR
jgi:hypothetical protein